MQKYVCDLCGYEYDPELGDPDSGIAPEQLLKIFRKTGPVPYAERQKMLSARCRFIDIPPVSVTLPR